MDTGSIESSGACCDQEVLSPQEQYFAKSFESEEVSFAVSDRGKEKISGCLTD